MDEAVTPKIVTDEEAFTSKQFSFIVQGAPFYVHTKLVSQCSEPLDRMINGHLSEAQQGFAVLDDVEKETFVRFVRWMYSKDYPAVKHKIFRPGSVEAQTSSPHGSSEDDVWGFAPFAPAKKKKKKKVEIEKTGLLESFISRQYDLDEEWIANPPPAPRSNKGPKEDYSDVLLSHAKIYVFAEKYDIQALNRLALKKLQQTLAIYTLYYERVDDILGLLKYVYANTAETKPETEDIRTMLAHYVGCEMETLLKHGEIRNMMSENDEMLGDFLQMFAKRIC